MKKYLQTKLQEAKDKLKWAGLYNKNGIKKASRDVAEVESEVKWDGLYGKK